MKSKLFRNSEAFKEDFFKLEAMKRDMAAMLSIGTDKLSVFVNAVSEMVSTGVSEHQRIVEAALPQIGVERFVFDRACNAAGWLATEFFPRGRAVDDTPEDIVDDMIQLKIIAEEQRLHCGAFVGAVKYAVQVQMVEETEKERALRKGAPKVVGVDTALFFRNVFRKGPASR